MLREPGVVVSVGGKYAEVVSHRQGACGGCHAESSCAVLSGGAGKRETKIRVLNPVGAQVGERVEIEISEGNFMKASFLVYGLPIVVLVLLGSLGRYLALELGVAPASAESVGGVVGVLALGLSFWWLHRINVRYGHDDGKLPSISKVLGNPDPCSVPDSL